MLRMLAVLATSLSLCACAQVEERLNQVQRTWDASPKTVTIYSLSGAPVKTYDIGRSKITRAEAGGDYVYFYADGKYVQTNMPYVVEGK